MSVQHVCTLVHVSTTKNNISINTHTLLVYQSILILVTDLVQSFLLAFLASWLNPEVLVVQPDLYNSLDKFCNLIG